MRKLIVLMAVMICLVAVLATIAIAKTGDKPMLKPSEFVIIPWGGVPGDLDTLKEIRDCGFNLAGFVYPKDLDNVSEVGLQCLVYDWSIQVGEAETKLDQAEIDKRVEAVVKLVNNHKAAYGYVLRDEPGANAFPGLGRWVSSFKKAAPGALAYINLFPNYASPEQMHAPTYDDYVESFVKTVQPEFLSYDHYALIENGTIRDGYFTNLESMRKASLRHNLPFWNCVLSCAHFNYAEPSSAGFRFQAYTTMAYGGRGLSYFLYFGNHTGNYRLSPIDPFGNKTPTWDMLRDVNLQIQRIGPVYATLKSINVFHYPEVPKGCSGFETSKLLKSVEGSNLLVGEFEGPEGQPYVMIVNKDLQMSTSIGITFKEEGQILKVNQYSGDTYGFRGEDYWLAPGQGALLCVKKSDK